MSIPRVHPRPGRTPALTVALLPLLFACAASSEPSALPPDAVSFEPEPLFAEWWAQMEGCSGQTGDYTSIHWYVVPGEEPFIAPPLGKTVIGYWDPDDNRIVLLQYVPSRSALVRHEMLHALIRRGDHPPAFFQDRCGAVINGPGLPPD